MDEPLDSVAIALCARHGDAVTVRERITENRLEFVSEFVDYYIANYDKYKR